MSGSWTSSDRRDRLPPDWEKIRKRVLRRDHGVCQADSERRLGQSCGKPANQVDHVRAGDDHSEENLQALCEWHHNQKSGREGAEASRKARAQRATRFRRTEERHPGLL